MGGRVGKNESPNRGWLPETKLEAKMVEAVQRRASVGTSIKSFNSLILKFPKIDESLRKCKAIFDQFDEDKNGAIDHEELRHCFHKLEFSFTDEEINNLFEACDLNKDMGMTFNEFIVLLCLVYLFKEDPTAINATVVPACKEFRLFIFPSRKQFQSAFRNWLVSSVIIATWLVFSGLTVAPFVQKSCMGMPTLEATFDTLVEAFVFLDKNNDGYVSKNEMIAVINKAASGELSAGQIAHKIFDEMDWDHNGMVNFKEFLFAFTRWVGIDESDDEEEEPEERD